MLARDGCEAGRLVNIGLVRLSAWFNQPVHPAPPAPGVLSPPNMPPNTEYIQGKIIAVNIGNNTEMHTPKRFNIAAI